MFIFIFLQKPLKFFIMKKIFLITILSVLTGLFFFNFSPVNEGPNSWLKGGTKLTYHLVSDNSAYDFIVSDLKIDEKISFKWNMTEPASISGSVIINKNALDNATNIVDDFSNGSSLIMDDQTTVWLSRLIYKNIKDQKPVDVKFDGNPETIKFKSNEKLKINVDGTDKEVNVLYAETQSGHQLWILDDNINPLIIKMQLGFTIELKSVVSTK